MYTAAESPSLHYMLLRGFHPFSAWVRGARGTPRTTSGSKKAAPYAREGGLALGDQQQTFPRLPGQAAENVRREANPSQQAGLSLFPAVPLLSALQHGWLLGPFTTKGSSGGAEESIRTGCPACKNPRTRVRGRRQFAEFHSVLEFS